MMRWLRKLWAVGTPTCDHCGAEYMNVEPYGYILAPICEHFR